MRVVGSEHYQVGYRRPPRHSQFRKGQSGNPRGRPRGAKDLKTELAEELNEWVSITENGKSRRVRKRRVILKALTAKAAKGDVKAADKIIDLHIQMFGFENQRTEKAKLSENDDAILARFLGDEDDNSLECAGDIQSGNEEDGNE